MPRGRKKTDVAPQDLLNEVLASIEETEQKLKALRTQKKDIEKQIEAKEMAELYAIVKEKNMSIEDDKTETRRRISLALLSEHKRKIHISQDTGDRIFLFLFYFTCSTKLSDPRRSQADPDHSNSFKIDSPIIFSAFLSPKLSSTVAPMTPKVFCSSNIPFSFIDGE